MSLETCPNCGAELSPRAKACPDCGSCEETGWSENADHERLGIPHEEFNYNQFVQEEFGPEIQRRPGRWWLWVGTALLLAAVLAGFAFFR